MCPDQLPALQTHSNFIWRNKITQKKCSPFDSHLPIGEEFCTTFYFSKFGAESLIKWSIMDASTLDTWHLWEGAVQLPKILGPFNSPPQ